MGPGMYRLASGCSGGRTRTPNDWTRTSCVAYYTTPEGGRLNLPARPVASHPDCLRRWGEGGRRPGEAVEDPADTASPGQTPSWTVSSTRISRRYPINRPAATATVSLTMARASVHPLIGLELVGET